jgi:formate dehydrogenase subunit gamma
MTFRLKRLGRFVSLPLLVVLFLWGAPLSPMLDSVGTAAAQSKGEVPGQAIGGSSDSESWRAIRRGLRGGVSIPNKRAGVMIQSEGENWRAVRNGPVSIYGVWLLGGVLVLLALFFALRGRIRIESGFSGRLIQRFNDVERFAHWLTASSFVILGLTGLNMLYGRYVIQPWLGKDGFSTLTEWGKYAHDFLGFAFIAGIVMILVIWVRDNIPNRLDLAWLAKGGGLFTRGSHPPAHKFNAGQKIVFWLVVLAGGSLSYTGLALLFPFSLEPWSGTLGILNVFGFGFSTDLSPMQEMQLSQLWHVILSLVMIAVILAHIYIGWIGMEGAYDAMGSGYVDENWAREHHSLWVEENESELGRKSPTEPAPEQPGE